MNNLKSRNIIIVLENILAKIPKDDDLHEVLIEYKLKCLNSAPELYYSGNLWQKLQSIIVFHIGGFYPKDGWKKEVIDIYSNKL